MRRSDLAAAIAVTVAAVGVSLLGPGCGGSGSDDAASGDAASADGSLDGALDGGSDSPFEASADAHADALADAAAPGDAGAFALDPTFGDAGVAMVGFGGQAPIEVISEALQADGKLVVGAHTLDAFVVERYLTSGTLDPSFGNAGTLEMPMGASTYGCIVMIRADQTIDVVGTYAPLGASSDQIVAFHLNAGGALDPTFGTGGYTTVPGWAWTATHQSDGAILVGGEGTSSTGGFLVSRILPTGALDTTFGSGGTANVTVNGDHAQAFAVVQQTNGAIVVGGADYASGSSYPLFLARLTATGAVDTTFATGGFVTAFPTTTGASDVTALALQSDGKIVVGAYVSLGGAALNFAVGRYAADGTPDTTFGGASTSGNTPGWYADTSASSGAPSVLTVQANGHIVATGCEGSACGAARFDANGAPDTTFGSSGFASIAPLTGAGFGGVVQSDGSIVGAGPMAGDVVVARLQPSGALDPTYGTSGITETPVTASNDVAFAGAIQSDGKPIAVGTSSAGGTAVVRLSTAGAVDSTFAQQLLAEPTEADGVILQSTGDVVVADSETSNGTIAGRVLPNGQRDSSFGSNGNVGAPNLYGAVVALAASDELVLAGSLSSNGFVVAKLTANGQLDTTFGSNGEVETPPSAFGASSAGAGAVVVLSDGRIVAAGKVDAHAGLARYTAAGVLDTTFGSAGVTTLDLGAPAAKYALAVQPDGKLLLAAQRMNPNGSSDLVIARLTSAGVADASFGNAGIAVVPLGSVEPRDTRQPFPIGLALASDGRIFACAGTSADGITEHMLVVRFDASGALDARSVLSLSRGNDVPHALALQSDGKVVVFGNTWSPTTGEDFAIVRLIPPP